jgi:hypothetical protein
MTGEETVLSPGRVNEEWLTSLPTSVIECANDVITWTSSRRDRHLRSERASTIRGHAAEHIRIEKDPDSGIAGEITPL